MTLLLGLTGQAFSYDLPNYWYLIMSFWLNCVESGFSRSTNPFACLVSIVTFVNSEWKIGQTSICELDELGSRCKHHPHLELGFMQCHFITKI